MIYNGSKVFWITDDPRWPNLQIYKIFPTNSNVAEWITNSLKFTNILIFSILLTSRCCNFNLFPCSQVCFFIFGYFLPLLLIICLYSVMINRLLAQVDLHQWNKYLGQLTLGCHKILSFSSWIKIWPNARLIIMVVTLPQTGACSTSSESMRNKKRVGNLFSFYRTQVYLGSDLWVQVSQTDWVTDVWLT